MLKLCLALPIFYPTFGGGPLRNLRAQPGLRKRDVHARVLAGTSRTKDALHITEDLGWDRYSTGKMLPIEHVEGTPVHRVRLPDENGTDRTEHYFRALIALCQDPKTRPDVIQFHSFERLDSIYWLWRLKRLGIPILYANWIAYPPRPKVDLRRRIKTWSLRAFYHSFDGVVTNSESIACDLRHRLGVRKPISVISNGVDLSLFRPSDDPRVRSRTRASLGIKGEGPVLLSVGAVSPRKGSDLLVEAWSKLMAEYPDAELVFAGPRHDKNNSRLRKFHDDLNARIANSRNPDRVHFAGVRDDMNSVYAASDIVVLASNREGMPNVMLEAMACERPVLITPFAGQSTAIGRPGIEFEQSERSPEALARALSTLLADPCSRADRVQSGKTWVTRHLDLDDSLDEFRDLYARAAEGRLIDRASVDLEATGKRSSTLSTHTHSN
jgi:glycosyltransferase involved in cell wall biosynthesis